MKSSLYNYTKAICYFLAKSFEDFKVVFLGENIDQKQLKYLSQTIQLEEKVNSYLIKLTMLLIAFSTLFFLIWSMITEVSEVTRATGLVIPQGRVHKVQHLSGGTIKEILVKEGEKVVKGQALVLLDDTNLKHEFESLKAEKIALLIQRERIQAIVTKREPDFSKFNFKNEEQLAKHTTLYESSKLNFEKELEVLKQKIVQKDLEIESLNSDYQVLNNKIKLVKDSLKIEEKLHKEGLVTKIAFINRKKELNDLIGDYKKVEIDIKFEEESKRELANRKDALFASQNEKFYLELENIKLNLSKIDEELSSISSNRSATVLKSNSHGIVKGISIFTTGEIVEAGQTVLEVVPLTEELYVELNISPNDVGHLKLGQKLNIKFNTYDFSRYGFMESHIDHISATTFYDREGVPYYKAIARLPKNYLGRNPASQVITSGMTLEASIITGEKNILSYLLKPIHRSVESALTER